MINTVWGSTEKPNASQQLVDALAESGIEGTLYIGYPIIGTPEGPFPVDGLLISPTKGLVLINVVEGSTLPDAYEADQDKSFNKMHAKLRLHETLIRRRELMVKLHTLTFAPAVAGIAQEQNSDYLICNKDNLVAAIGGLAEQESKFFEPLVAAIQAISNLRKGKRREIKSDDSRGAKVKRLEDSIANLDTQQSAAVVETFEGVQRIRGLAGSGKTIVLALKVAYLHARHPDWDIAVTFNTRSLKKLFESLITKFVLEQTNAEPDWDKVKILNAWGAPGNPDRAGIYFEFCRDNGVEYYDFKRASFKSVKGREFASVCDEALKGVKKITPKYDAVFIDEAQDFDPSFLLLCYEILNQPKRLVYAYDELQNLDGRSVLPMEDIFGKKTDGSPRVVLQKSEVGKPKQDIVLDTCYRNSRPVLTTAHALGFGIYSDKGLVQIFEDNNLWLGVGYELAAGDLSGGQPVVLRRTHKTSPEFLENHSDLDDLITFEVCDSVVDQTARVVSSIRKNLDKDELLPDDIVVINIDPLKTRDAVSAARRILLEGGINSNLAGVTSAADVFVESGNVTFTGIFRVKGNEAAMVYIINAQDCVAEFSPQDIALGRNRLFTAMTRSKAWVRVLGIGPKMVELKKEFEKVKTNDFTLKFTYPTDAEKERMTVINRDMSSEDRGKVRQQKRYLEDILHSLDAGDTFIEDYPVEVIEKFRAHLNGNR